MSVRIRHCCECGNANILSPVLYQAEKWGLNRQGRGDGHIIKPPQYTVVLIERVLCVSMCTRHHR